MSTFFKPKSTKNIGLLLEKAEQQTNAILSGIGSVALVAYDQAVPNFYDEVLASVIKQGANNVSTQTFVEHLSTAIKPTTGDTLTDLTLKARAAVDSLDKVVKTHTQDLTTEATLTSTISLN